MKRHINITCSVLGLTVGAALFFAAGCSKQEKPAGDTTKAMSPAASETPKPAAESAQPAAASQAASSAPSEAPKTLESPKAAAEQTQPTAAAAAQPAVDQAASQANATAATSTSQAQGLIEKAQGLVTNEKYKDALTVVQQLASVKLTPEQRTLVDGLKAQIQTALAKDAASDATSALGNVLGGKK